MKKLLILLLLSISFTAAQAGHIAGGEMYYKYLGPGGTPTTLKYEITLRLFRECNPPPGQGGTQIAPIPASVTIGIFNNTNPATLFTDRSVARSSLEQLSLSTPTACIVNAPQVCYQVANYSLIIDLPLSASGYVASFQTCCRTNGIANIAGSSVGATYSAEIPATSGSNPVNNSSAVFQLKDTSLVCQDLNFKLDFSAIDPDNDSLSYAFCAAYDGGTAIDAGAIVPSRPPYNSINYGSGFSGSQPLGNNVFIDPKTGLISGRAPGAGSYVINVCVSEYKNGRLLSIHRKDFTIKIGNCTVTEAKLPQPGYSTLCDSYEYTFENLSTSSNIAEYLWEFFDPGSGDKNTSTDPRPVHKYSDTGVFKIKLKVKSTTGCTDSTLSVVRVYPGFFPDFETTGSCFLTPFQYRDKSTTRYGVVDKWRWDFGDPNTTADTSIARNPTYKYDITGEQNVQLIVGSSKGCLDTLIKKVMVKDVPFLKLPFKDTLICSIDTLLLKADGLGAFSWSPAYNIGNNTSATPFVYPKQTTSYIVTLNENGCISKDTVKVNVLDFITVKAGIDSSMCINDSFVLRPQTQGLQFAWSPTAGLSDSKIKNPFAAPKITTQYRLMVNLGKCSATDSFKIVVAPYPQAYAGLDTSMCFGSQVNLTGNIVGSSFAWTPANTLRNANTLIPVASPAGTTPYILTVYDTLGCIKPYRDTVLVKVIPPIRAFAGNDTIIVANQPLQLNGSGGSMFQWSPAFGLNNTQVSNPVVTLGPGIETFRYVLRVSEPEGCFGTDDVVVTVYKTGPDLFIPTAFTPNRDGKNDILKPIPVGIKALVNFKIYNRWGQVIFSTSAFGKGWDGQFGGFDQPSGTYVFSAEAIDYLDKKIIKKGTIVLIR